MKGGGGAAGGVARRPCSHAQRQPSPPSPIYTSFLLCLFLSPHSSVTLLFPSPLICLSALLVSSFLRGLDATLVIAPPPPKQCCKSAAMATAECGAGSKGRIRVAVPPVARGGRGQEPPAGGAVGQYRTDQMCVRQEMLNVTVCKLRCRLPQTFCGSPYCLVLTQGQLRPLWVGFSADCNHVPFS